MWEFSQMCKFLIEKSNMSIYKIAKISGLERTALNRMVNGKRLLNMDDFEKFCDAIRVGKKDKDKLYELYLIEKIGKKKYENRKCIIDILEYMDSLGRDSVLNLSGEKLTDGAPAMMPEKKMNIGELYKDACVSGERQVKILLRHVLDNCFHDGIETVYTNLPTTYYDFFENIEYLYSVYRKKIKVYHYFMLHSNPQNYYNGNYNLEQLKRIMPWMVSECMEYYPHYTYGDSMVEDLASRVISYYVVTAECVIQITAEFDYAIIHTEERIVNFYHEKIQRENQKSMHSFICGSCGLQNVAQSYLEYVSQVGRLTHCLEPAPCISMAHGDIAMEEGAWKVEKGMDQEKMNWWVGGLSNEGDTEPAVYTDDCMNVFTYEGLKQFCYTGKVKAQAAALCEEFSLEQRDEILEEIERNLLNDKIRFRVMTNEMPVISNINIELYERGIMFILFLPNNQLRIILVKEGSICESFQDFVESMEEMKLCESKEESLRIIQEMRKNLALGVMENGAQFFAHIKNKRNCFYNG